MQRNTWTRFFCCYLVCSTVVFSVVLHMATVVLNSIFYGRDCKDNNQRSSQRRQSVGDRYRFDALRREDRAMKVETFCHACMQHTLECPPPPQLQMGQRGDGGNAVGT
jgi:hypothetical protein